MSERHATGSRAPWSAMPHPIQAWVESLLGSPVVSVLDQSGGMSPGAAARIRGANGRRVFVKAVGSELNPDTPGLFRRERETLTLLGTDPRWAGLLADWDDGDWVALALEDVEGRHPDVADDTELAAVLAATDELGAVLGARVPEPPATRSERGPSGSGAQPTTGLLDYARGFARWADAVPLLARIPRTEDGAAPPAWLLPHLPVVRERVRALAEPGRRRLVHGDIRVDNLLTRPDGRVVFVDWGMAGVGPAWLDPVLARLERVDSAAFDASLTDSPALRAAGEETVTSYLLGLGCWLLWRAHTAEDRNLPTLRRFRLDEARRCLVGARRRLGWG